MPVATASADVVVADDQIITGQQCIGTSCADGEVFVANLGIKLKTSNTPGLRLEQSASPWPAQTWDIAGNEASFFIRDVTGGSRLPFRIRPGAATSSIDIYATSEVNTAGVVNQNLTPDGITVTGDADGAAVLTALRTLPIRRYTVNVDSGAAPHLAPTPAAFRSAFTLGGNDNRLATADVAAVALAAVKELDARVSAISLTPGPQGEQGPQGATGELGATGAPGSVASDPATRLAVAEKKIATLQSSNKKLFKKLKRLNAQVTKLMAAR